jgi:hypothetical protein
MQRSLTRRESNIPGRRKGRRRHTGVDYLGWIATLSVNVLAAATPVTAT